MQLSDLIHTDRSPRSVQRTKNDTTDMFTEYNDSLEKTVTEGIRKPLPCTKSPHAEHSVTKRAVTINKA